MFFFRSRSEERGQDGPLPLARQLLGVQGGVEKQSVGDGNLLVESSDPAKEIDPFEERLEGPSSEAFPSGLDGKVVEEHEVRGRADS